MIHPCRLIILTLLLVIVSCENSPEAERPDPFLAHYATLVKSLTDQYGETETPVWLSSWNLESNRYPFEFSRPDSIPCRVYLDRSVDAPGGATLYWDLPDMAAAVLLSNETGDGRFEQAAKAYVGFYLDKCTADNGVILWGNHYYYDVLQDTPVRFQSKEPPRPVDFSTETGDLHEMRPLLPPWELLYDWFPSRVERHIRQSVQQHLADPETGAFNRHANGESEYAFLEAGAVLIHSLAFLYEKTKDPELLDLAERILQFSFSNRDPETGLVINSPSRDRWDQHSSTTEIGLWTLYVLKAADHVPSETAERWVRIVETALAPWLKYGFDDDAGMFYGSLNVTTGEPIEKTDDYPYKPDTYTDIWNPLFPIHDYPMYFAESCLKLYQMTGKEIYRDSAGKWLMTVKHQLEERENRLLYAENYARVIHFLYRYGMIFEDSEAIQQADILAEEAIEKLYVPEARLFRGHTGEMRYDAVDGVGLLFFACKELENETNDFFERLFF